MLWAVHFTGGYQWVEKALVTSICEEEHLKFVSSGEQSSRSTANVNRIPFMTEVYFYTKEAADKFVNALKKKLPEMSTVTGEIIF